MRVLLIILVILSYIGGVGAIAGITKARGAIPIDIVFVLCIVTVCNVVCALYLYKKAACSKVEWALFGVIGNLSALFFFWLFDRKQEKLKP